MNNNLTINTPPPQTLPSFSTPETLSEQTNEFRDSVRNKIASVLNNYFCELRQRTRSGEQLPFSQGFYPRKTDPGFFSKEITSVLNGQRSEIISELLGNPRLSKTVEVELCLDFLRGENNAIQTFLTKYYMSILISKKQSWKQILKQEIPSLSEGDLEKTLLAAEILFRFDFRREFNSKAYRQIVLKLAEQIKYKLPVNLVQFTCPQREALKVLSGPNPENSIKTDSTGNNLSPYLSTLLRIKAAFDKIKIPLEITVLIGDTDVIYIESRQGAETSLTESELISRLEPRFEKYRQNPIEEMSFLTEEQPLRSIKIKSFWQEEERLRQNNIADFRSIFQEARNFAPEWLKKQDPLGSIATVLRTMFTRGLEAFYRGELATNPLDQEFEKKIRECSERKFAEYAAQSVLLESIAGNPILLQNERPVDTKDQMYNNLRDALGLNKLPIIYPFFIS